MNKSHKREQITKQFRRGLITDDERYNAVTAEHVQPVKNWKTLADNQDPEEPTVMMMDPLEPVQPQLAGMWLDGRPTDGSNSLTCQTSAKVCHRSTSVLAKGPILEDSRLI